MGPGMVSIMEKSLVSLNKVYKIGLLVGIVKYNGGIIDLRLQ